MESFATIINKVVNYCCNVLHLRCLRGPGLASTIFMLHFFNTEKYWKWTKKRKNNQKTTLHSEPWTCFTFILISYNTFLSLYSFEWLIKWKGTNLLFCLELLKLGCALKSISPTHKVSCRYFNYDIENGLRKNIIVLKKYSCWPFTLF